MPSFNLNPLIMILVLSVPPYCSGIDNANHGDEFELARTLHDLRQDPLKTDLSLQGEDFYQDEWAHSPEISLLVVPSQISADFQAKLITQRPHHLLMITNPTKIALPKSSEQYFNEMMYLPSGTHRVLSHHEFVDDVFASFHELVPILLKADDSQQLNNNLISWWLNTVNLFGSAVELQDALNQTIHEMDTNLKGTGLHLLFKMRYYNLMVDIATNQTNVETTKHAQSDLQYHEYHLQSPAMTADRHLQSLEIMLMFAECAWNHIFELEMDCNSVYLEGEYVESYPIDIRPDHERYTSMMTHLLAQIRMKFIHKIGKQETGYWLGTVLKRCYAEHLLFTNTIRTMYWIYEWIVVEKHNRDISVVIINVDFVEPLREEFNRLALKHQMFGVTTGVKKDTFLYHQMLDVEPASDIDDDETRIEIVNISNENGLSHLSARVSPTVDTVKLYFVASPCTFVDIEKVTKYLHEKYIPYDLMVTPRTFDPQHPGIRSYSLDIVFDAVHWYFNELPTTWRAKEWMEMYREPLINLFSQHSLGLKDKIFEKINHFSSGSTSAAVMLVYLKWTCLAGRTDLDFYWMTEEEMVYKHDVLLVVHTFILELLDAAFQMEYDALQQILGQQHMQQMMRKDLLSQTEVNRIVVAFHELKDKMSGFMKRRGHRHGTHGDLQPLLEGSCGTLSKWLRQLLIVQCIFEAKVLRNAKGDVSVVLPEGEDHSILLEMLHSMPQKVGQYFQIKTYNLHPERIDQYFSISVLAGAQ